MNGYGRADYNCGSYYDGEFCNGQRQGLGLLVYPHTRSAPMVPAIPGNAVEFKPSQHTLSIFNSI